MKGARRGGRRIRTARPPGANGRGTGGTLAERGEGAAAPGGAGAPEQAAAPARGANHPPHLLVNAGQYAWALIGIVIFLAAVGWLLAQLSLVVIPLVIALFPAALLEPVMRLLRRARVPGALAAILVILGGFGLLFGVGRLLVPQIADEVPRLAASVQEGLAALQTYLEEGRLGIDPAFIQENIDRIEQGIVNADFLRTGVLGAASAVAEMTAMTLLLLVVLFFYLKDGGRIARWLQGLFPRSARDDLGSVAGASWETIGAYFRGQLFVALVDGVLIGVGLAILGVPLALPLGVLVFFGGLFPIVGAVVTGAVAVLVALADGGIVVALIALAIVLAVQQLESNVLAPMVLGKATEMHPLAVLTSLTAGGILLGVLGAFIAVPIAASLARAIGLLRERHGTA